jgi:acyl-coenzyme A thioesterase PaaI-like protein
VTDTPAFQDLMPGNYCWGCGPTVETGLKLKSRWEGDLVVCHWTPRPEFAAGPKHILYGGMISAIMDCHSIWTAIATAYREESRHVGSDPLVWFVTGSLKVTYRKPTLIDQPLTLTSQVEKVDGRKSSVTCSLTSGGEETAVGEMLAVRVPLDWFKPRTHEG